MKLFKKIFIKYRFIASSLSFSLLLSTICHTMRNVKLNLNFIREKKVHLQHQPEEEEEELLSSSTITTCNNFYYYCYKLFPNIIKANNYLKIKNDYKSSSLIKHVLIFLLLFLVISFNSIDLQNIFRSFQKKYR